MNRYEVEVPVYLQVAVEASNRVAASAAAEKLVSELADAGQTPFRSLVCPDSKSSPCAFATGTRVVLLDEDEDRAPDVYLAEGAEEGPECG